jgi:DNA-binding protein HU-beta
MKERMEMGKTKTIEEQKPLTHSELVENLAKEMGTTRIQAASFLAAVYGQITKSLIDTGKARLGNIGTFEVFDTAARAGINPRTLEPMEIPAGKRIAFRAAKALKERIG